MKKTLLQQELAPLNAKIEQMRGTLAGLQGEMRAVQAELDSFSPDRQRFDALRETCNLLNRLDELQAGQLFWGELPEIKDHAGHVARLQSRIACFDEKIDGILEKQADLQMQVDRGIDQLEFLYEEVDKAYDRDERRACEFAIERELSEVPHPAAVMPWCTNDENERRYRRTFNTAMFLSLLLAIIIRLVTVPAVVRPIVAPIPERLAMMVRQEPVKPEPVKKTKEEKKAEHTAEKKEQKTGEKAVAENNEKVQSRELPAPARAKAAPVEQTAAPRRAANTGVLAFKESFKDLLDETPVARLGSEARVSSTNQAGHALANRSLVAMQGGRGSTGGSGGIGSAEFTRNGGSGGIGDAAVGRTGNGGGNSRIGRGGTGNGFTKVKSNIAGLGGKESAKPLSVGGRPSRTDEEIQLLFDRYKAALYRIYNTELRNDPTLRGKMVLRITIEPGGEVSACTVESCNMNAPEFSEKIVSRVKKINFGPKDGVPRTTILYPIDFLPAR